MPNCNPRKQGVQLVTRRRRSPTFRFRSEERSLLGTAFLWLFAPRFGRCAAAKPRRNRGGAGRGASGWRRRARSWVTATSSPSRSRSAVRRVGAARVQLLVARHEIGPVRAQPVEADVAHLPAQVQRDAADVRRPGLRGQLEDLLDLGRVVVDARASAARPARRWGCPARLSSATASIRSRGCGVCGSVARHAFSSIVGIDRFALNPRRSAISLNSSMSRSSSGDFVSTEHGFRESRIASQIPRMSR